MWGWAILFFELMMETRFPCLRRRRERRERREESQ